MLRIIGNCVSEPRKPRGMLFASRPRYKFHFGVVKNSHKRHHGRRCRKGEREAERLIIESKLESSAMRIVANANAVPYLDRRSEFVTAGIISFAHTICVLETGCECDLFSDCQL